MGLFLGIDAGTQSIKGILIDPENGWRSEPVAVHYGKDLPQYGSPDGYLPNADARIRRANPLMWLAALDLLLARMQEAGLPMTKITGISGSGQQHGSVYLNETFADSLARLNPARTLAEQLAPTLARQTAPIWMDHSTVAECEELRSAFGPKIQQLTGSAPTERFTGPQIRKFAKDESQAYGRTAVIHLVSSFLCSVLAGSSAPIDIGDGAGMNLLDLNTLCWSTKIAEFMAPGLMTKLPLVTVSTAQAGGLSPYFCKYGLTAEIPVIAWSGDNPNSLIGIGCSQPGTVGVSLGSSDTVFAPLQNYTLDEQGYGHIMGNPAGGFMSLICFTNGSLARERVRRDCQADWDFFDRQACAQTPPGNNGKLILPWFEPESTPAIATAGAIPNYDESQASAAEKIRAILESQALAMRLHTQWLPEKITRIRLTGGASRCLAMRQILADVFQAEVETISVTESAAMGAAMRAANGAGRYDFSQLEALFCRAVETVHPTVACTEVYDRALARYTDWEQRHL